jgi:SAM-dependent methyltransferase
LSSNPTERFSARVPYYHASRPRYPQVVIEVMREHIDLTPTSIVADIGAGTGILSELFLKYGNTVYAVEPNIDMREASKGYYGTYSNFIAIDGRAEATSLKDLSVDFVVAGQAFHWFDQPKARVEFKRILKPGGYVVLIWNVRHNEASPFLGEYNDLVREFDTEKGSSPRVNESTGAEIGAFFAPEQYALHTAENVQVLDFEGLRGRLLSASYAPLPDHPEYDAMIARLRMIFDKYQVNQRVEMTYRTEIYWGRLQG